ncbi:PP2C family protein-serine/threonine phosphatase [Devosia sp. A449]
MKFEYATFTDAGPRKINEDSVAVWKLPGNDLIVAIADGLGGMGGGNTASGTAISEISSAISEQPDVGLWFSSIAIRIHHALLISQRSSRELSTMATTLTAAWFTQGRMMCVHAGDSRLAMARNNGVKRLTTDHSEGMRLLLSGKLTQDEYADYPRKHILDSALGTEDTPRVDIFDVDLAVGDKLIFTTDGIHQKVFLRELQRISSYEVTPHAFAARVAAEVEARNPDDNYSLAAVYCRQ